MMDGEREVERRSTPRYSVDLRASFWLDEAADAAPKKGQVTEVSWGGLFLSTRHLAPPGTPVRLLVAIARPEETLPLQGEVAWAAPEGSARGPGMGIRLHVPL